MLLFVLARFAPPCSPLPFPWAGDVSLFVAACCPPARREFPLEISSLLPVLEGV